MATPTLADLRYLWYGGGSAEEYAFLLQMKEAGISAADILARGFYESANPGEMTIGPVDPDTGISLITLTDQIARANALIHGKFTVGQWYENSGDVPIDQPLTNNQMVWVPRILRPGNINGISVNVSVLAAATGLRLAIAADNNGVPSAVISQGVTSSDASTTGAKEVAAFSCDIPTWDMYWLGVVAQGGAPSVRAYTRPAYPIGLGTALPGTSPNRGARTQAGVTGVIPTNPTLDSSVTSACPRICVRYSN